MTVLVIAEHDNAIHQGRNPQHRHCRCSKCGGDVHVPGGRPQRRCRPLPLPQIAGVAKVIHADAAAWNTASPKRRRPGTWPSPANYSHILFPATASGKNVAARGRPARRRQISDITGRERRHLRAPHLRRQRHRHRAKQRQRQGHHRAHHRLRRRSRHRWQRQVETAAAAADSGKSSFIGSEIAKSDRPELTAAKIIVSGGRALGSARSSTKSSPLLADKLGAAIGASRAAVDAGYGPNDLASGPDRQDRGAAAVHRCWYLGCHPALGGDEGFRR